jgi:hypothetical protein
MPHSQGLSNNPYSELNQFLIFISISLRSILILISHLCLCLPKGIFPVGLPVKILQALLPFLHFGYMTCPFILLVLITLNILRERYKL